MEVLKKLHNAVDGIGKLPLLYDMRKAKYDRRFETAIGLNLFRGIYPDYESAQSALPAARPAGYDHNGPASMYEDRTSRIYVSDYPVLYWLSQLLTKNRRNVFEVGGHIGVAYYGYQKYINFPEQIQWKILDVPAVVERGRELAKTKDRLKRLEFTTTFQEASGADILFASGSIQYLPETLWSLLQKIEQKPEHILVNLLPLHASKTYFTVQTIGTAFCPYRIESRESFITGLGNIGYELADQWDNLEKRCEIPFVDPAYSLDRYYGFFFRRSGS